ncbi:cell wall protein DAN4-like isoform X2 [Gymnodraco acuticeps]|uniref:ATP synthase peripheral stalk subunit F6, mitochondrial n=1 Tax=Gymnodraco acuticeps TaxID=8218 RepID=A0A6P8UKE7_GYMAC|nr:cell wall protein DAN4-like isoform X2 [Gymnodraco acuticeps]
MAAVLLRRGTGLCCFHRELCRVVWRSQTALYSFKSSDRNPPRRTHIKKAKTQPAVDVFKLLEQIFSYRRPGSTPPAAQARPTTPPTTTSNVPNCSKREPAVSLVSSTTKQVSDDLSKVTVPASSTTSAALASNTSAIESHTLTEAKETKEETDSVLLSSAHSQETNMETSSSSALTVETSIETALKSVEPEISPVETLEVRAVFAIDAPAEKVTDSEVSYSTKEELISGTTESVEIINSPVETLETGAAVSEMTQKVETNTTDLGFGNLSHTAEEIPLIETTESPIEANHVALESLETIPHVVEGPVEPTIDVTVHLASPNVETQSTDSGSVNLWHTDQEETLIETTHFNLETIDTQAAVGSIETTIEDKADTTTQQIQIHFPVETLETEAAVLEHPVQSSIDVTVHAVETKSTDSGVSSSTKEEPLIETIEPVAAIHVPLEPIETKTADAEGSVETTLEMQTNSTDLGLVNLSHTTKEEPLIETMEAHNLSFVTLETEAAVSEHPVETTVDVTAQVEDLKVETQSTDSGLDDLSYTAKEEALIERTVETSTSAFSEGPIEPTIETEEAGNLSHAALILNAQDTLPLNNESNVESCLVNVDEALIASLKNKEHIPTTFFVEGELLKEIGANDKAAVTETENLSDDERDVLTQVPSSFSEDLHGLKGTSGMLVKELLCHVPAELSKTPEAKGEHTEEEEAMTLESITLSKVMEGFGGLEALLETRNALEEQAEVLAKEEEMRVETTQEDVVVYEDTSEEHILTLDSISEATDAIEAETAVMLEAILGLKQAARQQEERQNGESIVQEAEKESVGQQASVLDAMAEVEASLETLENESLSETTDHLEIEADCGEVEDMEATETLKMSEDLQIDVLTEERFISVSGHEEGVGPVGQEVIRADILEAAVVTEDLKMEEETHTGALSDEYASGTHADLDPVQRLFLEKIREYNNMHRLNEEDPDYDKHLSEERAKLQRFYGGGDLNSFPQFSFSEPEMDKDSK